MSYSIPSVIAFVTFFIGSLSKKFNILDKKYIPYQNILIGIISGFIVYITGLSSGILNSIITCTISSLGAGGFYDTLKVDK